MIFRDYKKILASFFTVLVIVPAFFMAPIAIHEQKLSASIAYAQQSGTFGLSDNVPPLPTEENQDKTFSCRIYTWEGLKGCLANIIYYLVVKVPEWIFLLVGIFTNAMFAFGLSSSTFRAGTPAGTASFLDVGWMICRDIANTFFIFILLYIAILTILQMAGGATKRMLATLIVVALLMNFSMYITRFIVDVGNVFALEFYNAYPTIDNPYITIQNGVEQKSMTKGLLNSLLTPVHAAVVDVNNGGSGYTYWQSFYGCAITPDDPKCASARLNIPRVIALYMTLGAMILLSTFIFFTASLLMLARVVTIWILMILSPLAFFSWVLPNLKSKMWDRWFSTLISNCIFPAIFLFFVYLAATLSESNIVMNTFVQNKNVGDDYSFVTPIVWLMLVYGAIAAFLMMGLRYAKDAAGEAGQLALKIGGAVAGTGVIGTAAAAGRKFVGGGAQWISNKYGDRLDTLEKPWMRSIGQFANKSLKSTASSSFDLRNAYGVSAAAGAVGLALGGASGAGGYAKSASEKQAAITRRAEELLKKYPNDPTMAAKYLLNQRKSILSYQGGDAGSSLRGVRVNPDEFTLGAWQSFSVKDRMSMIDSMPEGKEKEYLKTLNRSMQGAGGESKGFSEYEAEKMRKAMSKTGMSPKEQYSVFTSLSPAGQLEAYKTLTPVQREILKKEEDLKISSGEKVEIKLSQIHEKLTAEDQRRIIEAEQKESKIKKQYAEELAEQEKKNVLETASAADAKKILAEMKANSIGKLSGNILSRPEVAQHLNISAITQALQSGNLSQNHEKAIIGALMNNIKNVDRMTLEGMSKGIIRNLGVLEEKQISAIQEELSSRGTSGDNTFQGPVRNSETPIMGRTTPAPQGLSAASTPQNETSKIMGGYYDSASKAEEIQKTVADQNTQGTEGRGKT